MLCSTFRISQLLLTGCADSNVTQHIDRSCFIPNIHTLLKQFFHLNAVLLTVPNACSYVVTVDME